MDPSRKSETAPQKPEAMVVIGGGRVGSALATLAARSGCATTLWSRRPISLSGVSCHHGEAAPAELASADVIAIAVRDEAITPVAELLRSLLGGRGDRPVVVHLSGAQASAAALAPLAGVASLGTMHPLLAIRSAEQGAELMPRAFWMLEGSDIAVAICAEMIEAWGRGGLSPQREGGARWIRLTAEDLALYHACAVIASNHAVALWTAARDALRRLGSLDPETATAMLLPLLESTLANVQTYGLPEALTGPVRRGDVGTLRRHLAALRAREPALLASYRADAELARLALAGLSDDGSNLAMIPESEEE